MESLVGEGKPKTDVTFTVHYSFMAPDSDMEKGMRYFELCGYLESCMPDQINRGFGKHSLLGYINEQRSDIMLFNDLTIKNMSRALTQESTLVAKYDIVKVLIEAKRPYAEEVAKKFGIDDEFKGKYQNSELLSEKWPNGPFVLGGLLLLTAAGAGAAHYLKKKYGGKENGISGRIGIIKSIFKRRKE